jgi:hypothetical protein
MRTSDISKSYRWYTTDSWEEDISRDIVEVWFYDLYGYWTRRLFSVLVTLEDKVVLGFW